MQTNNKVIEIKIINDLRTIREGSLAGKPNKKIRQAALLFVNEEFEKYNQRANTFYSYLAAIGASISSRQFQLYRDNHFFRTLGVLPALACALEVAAWRGDHQTVSDLGKTIFEECGETRTPHLRLLEDAFNLHGEALFGLAPITMQQAENSPYLLKEAKTFREVQQEIFAYGSYPALLAATYVREAAAQLMLKSFYEAIFLPYRTLYRQKNIDFSPIVKFFASHIEGVEDEHAAHARAAALNACRNESDLVFFKEGVFKLLEAQSNLWAAMQYSMNE